MTDKYVIMDNNREIEKKPIEEVLELCKSLVDDVQTMKKDIYHMKNYVRKVEIREGIKDDLGNEYIKPESQTDVAIKKGWFW